MDSQLIGSQNVNQACTVLTLKKNWSSNGVEANIDIVLGVKTTRLYIWIMYSLHLFVRSYIHKVWNSPTLPSQGWRTCWKCGMQWDSPPQWCKKHHNRHQQPVYKEFWIKTDQISGLLFTKLLAMSRCVLYGGWLRLTGPKPPPAPTYLGNIWMSMRSSCCWGVWLVERRQGSDKT